MSMQPEFLIEESSETPLQETNPPTWHDWYKKLPQANMNVAGNLAARSVTGALQLHPYALALDLGGLALDQGIKYLGTEEAQKFRDYIPSSQDIIKPLEHLSGLEENPQGVERIFKNLGEYIQLAKGKGLKQTANKALALATGEEATANLLGDESRTAYKIAAPLGIKAGEPIATGKQANGQSTLSVAVENNPELKKMYEYGKSIGMTDKQLAPILQPDIKTRLLGRFGKKTKGMKEQIDETRTQIGNNYRNLKAQGRNDLIAPQHQNDLFDSLVDLHDDISRTNIIGPDNQAILSSIEEIADRMATQPQTVENLINSYQNINNIPNWNAANDGRKRLAQVNKFFQKAIESKNPKIGEEFALTNRMYAKQANIRKEIGLKKIPEDIFTVAETAGLLSGLAYGAITGDYKNAANIIGVSASRRIATQLLTNPKYQGIHRNMMKALTSGDQKALANALKVLDPILKKEAPQEWESAHSPEFILSD